MLHGGFPLSWLLLCGVMTLKMNLLRQIAAKAYFCLTWVVPRIPKNEIKLCFSCQEFNTPSRSQILAASWCCVLLKLSHTPPYSHNEVTSPDWTYKALQCLFHLWLVAINIMIKYKNLCLDTRLNICVLYVHKIRNIYASAHKVILKLCRSATNGHFHSYLLMNVDPPFFILVWLVGTVLLLTWFLIGSIKLWKETMYCYSLAAAHTVYRSNL